jgi:hypothetical protein
MRFHHALTSLALASTLALAGQAHAAADQGIDFDPATASVSIASTSVSNPTILRTVTATCPQSGFLYAMASSQFNPRPGAVNGAQFIYSLSKNSTAFDNSARYDFAIRAITDLAFVPASTLMRVDSLTAGQSVTYRLVAVKGVDIAALLAVQPKLVVTFFQTKI